MPDATRDLLMKEIDANLAFFESKMEELLPHHRGRYALLKSQKIVGIYDTLRDAQTAAEAQFPDGLCSIQMVTKAAVQLGVYSYAVPLGST